MLWIIFALLVGAAALIALWPLSRAVNADVSPARLVYATALSEIETDRSRGLLSDADVDVATTNAARMLIATSATSQRSPALIEADIQRKKIVSVIVLLLLPFMSFSLYSTLGAGDGGLQSPNAQSQQKPEDLLQALQKIEAHLKDHPDDGVGFEVVAPVYSRMGKLPQAINAYKQALRLLGETPERNANYAEALIVERNGEVSPEAERVLMAAVSAEPDQPKANYYLGAAAEQRGDTSKASEIWRALLLHGAPDAPWRQDVETRLAALNSQPAGKDAREIGTNEPGQISDTSAPMISSMVAGLAAKLEKDPAQLDGWLKLIRSYVVLKDSAQAQSTLNKAKAQFHSDAASLKQILDLAGTLGLEK